MINVRRMRRAWRVLRLTRRCRHEAPEAKSRGGQNRTVTPGRCKVGRFMRVLASGLMLNATFPLDVLAQTAPAAVAQPATGPAVQHGTARRAGGLDRALPRRPADPAPDGLDVPARSRGSGALGGGPGTQVAVRRCVGEGTGSRAVGPEREVPGAVPGRPGDHEQQSDLVAAARLCVRDAAGGRVRRGAAPSPSGAGERQAAVVAPAGREHAAGDGRATGGQQPAPDAAGGDRHPAGAVGHRLRAELQSGSGVRLVVALPVISAVLRGPAVRLLFRHRAGHRAGIRGRRRGRGRAMGLGEPGVGRRLRQRQRQPIQQHQRQPVADHFDPLGRGRWGGRPGNFARAPGGPVGLPGRSQVSVPGNAVRPPTRAGRRGRRRRRWSAGWSWRCGRRRRCRVGQAVRAASVVSAVPVGRAVREASVVSAVPVGQVVRAASVASAVLVGRAAWVAPVVSAVPVGQAVRAASVAPEALVGPAARDWRRPARRPVRSVRAAHLAI